MAELPFNMDVMEQIASSRIGWLTAIMLFFTFLGNTEGYILLVVLIYWIIDKKLGFQVAMVTVFSSIFNHIFKIIIRNPRPFVTEGTYQENWAIPDADKADTAREFSTPSGHAMGSASFWHYLYLRIKSPVFLIFTTFMFLMIGLSRPYLGVHYFEDIILGWFIGLIVAYAAFYYDTSVTKFWSRFSEQIKYVLIIGGSLVVIVVAGFVSEFNADGESFATNLGIFSGIIIGWMLEQRYVNFSTKFSNVGIAILRYVVGLVVVFAFLFGLDFLFAEISGDESLLGFILRYIRYASVGIAATYLVPMLFFKLKLAEKEK